MNLTPLTLLTVALLAGCQPQDHPSISASTNITTANDGFPLNKTETEWHNMLTPEQYHVLREAGTERPFSSELLKIKAEGTYVCAGCGQALFASDAKFDSGTGWPSFFKPIADKNISAKVDESGGMRREESVCANCGGHLGHVFPDGPKPTGLRYCMNGLALKFIPAKE